MSQRKSLTTGFEVTEECHEWALETLVSIFDEFKTLSIQSDIVLLKLYCLWKPDSKWVPAFWHFRYLPKQNQGYSIKPAVVSKGRGVPSRHLLWCLAKLNWTHLLDLTTYLRSRLCKAEEQEFVVRESNIKSL